MAADQTPGKRVYSPGHPDADPDGFVTMPNVNPVHEVVNLLSASRGYEANTTAVETLKQMAAQGPGDPALSRQGDVTHAPVRFEFNLDRPRLERRRAAPRRRAPDRRATAARPASASSWAGAVQQLDQLHVEADQQANAIANGGGNLHEVALAFEKADVAMRLATKVRNKLVEAYNEIMRMSV